MEITIFKIIIWGGIRSDIRFEYSHIILGLHISPFEPSVLFGTSANSAEPDQTPQNAASDQGLHCLLTNWSFLIRIKMKITT